MESDSESQWGAEHTTQTALSGDKMPASQDGTQINVVTGDADMIAGV